MDFSANDEGMPLDSFLKVLDVEPVLQHSRVRLGRARFTGVPAILVGVACIVAVAGIARVAQAALPILPETIRESRELWLVARADRPSLNP